MARQWSAAGPNNWVNNWGTTYGDGVGPWQPRHTKPAYHAAVAFQDALGQRPVVQRCTTFNLAPPPQCPACAVPAASDIFVLEFGARADDSGHAFAAWLGILWPADDTMVQLTFVVPVKPGSCYIVRSHLGVRVSRLCTEVCSRASGAAASCLAVQWGVGAAPIYLSADSGGHAV